MNNKKPLIIIISVLILLLLMFLVWKLSNKSTPNSQVSMEKQPQTINQEDTASTISGNVFDLLKLGKTLKCSYSMDSQGATISGISYISGNNMRGDFENTDPSGNTIQSHMISDGEWVYIWNSATSQGFKMNITDAESETTSPNSNTQNQEAFKNDVDYKCSPWTADVALFEVPSDITFTDFSQTIQNTNTDNKSSMCSACDYAQSDEDKAACLKQFNCE